MIAFRMTRINFFLAAVLIGGKGATSQNIGSDRLLKDSESASARRRLLRREDESRDEPLLEEEKSSPTLVDYLYTYGSAPITNPPMSNPGNKCIPGIRAYIENISSGRKCGWWEALWCNPNDHIANTDFVAQRHIDKFPHPKISTLVLHLRDDSIVEYIWKECKDSDGVAQYDFQSWPALRRDALSPFGVPLGDVLIHWPADYITRLMEVPPSIRGPMLEYASVWTCGYFIDTGAIKYCYDTYSMVKEIPGLDPNVWKLLVLIHPKSTTAILGTDDDSVHVMKNDEDPTRRRCIISFDAANHLSDGLDTFFGNGGYADYCGRGGVHLGLRNELRGITRDDGYSRVIKPALETCHEVTCVGLSLGGTMCNIFTMCANTGLENIRKAEALAASSNGTVTIDADMYDDYYSLAWNKKM